MNKTILDLEPKTVWVNFDKIANIPHPSKHEDAIRTFLVDFGKKAGVEASIDTIGNVIFKKPATKGMENRETVVLQAHMDMVPQKNNDKKHDFTKDPIATIVDGEWVRADQTTLGADNGMGLAAILSILESKDIAHGPIEALITTDEETGMTGAFGLKPGLLDGTILLNLDSEDEGELYVGCAGGLDAVATFTYNKIAPEKGTTALNLSVKGLCGGHSGMDIILGRGNANKMLFRMLMEFETKYQIQLSSVDGGSLRNAIPREATALIVVPNEHVELLKAETKQYQHIYAQELSATEPNITIDAPLCEMPKFVMDPKTQHNLIHGVIACPNGVERMSDSMPGLVETSNNLAIVKSNDEGTITVACLMRSSVDTAKEGLAQKIVAAFELAGAKVTLEGGYPGWKPNMESTILNTCIKVYENMTGKKPEIKAIHAGLECGLLGAVYNNWDMISFGPTIRSPHSPSEKVNIESVGKFWNYLVEILKNIPNKR